MMVYLDATVLSGEKFFSISKYFKGKFLKHFSILSTFIAKIRSQIIQLHLAERVRPSLTL